MVLNVTRSVVHKGDDRVNSIDSHFFNDIKQWPYKRISEALRMNALPQKKNEEFISVELPIYLDEVEVLETLYRLQLLGYIPIIIELEKNTFLKHRLAIVHQLILKGALIHIDALSLMGENGREARKYASKLCEKGYVHLITESDSEKRRSTSIAFRIEKYLKKKTSKKYVEFLKENKRMVYLGESFHVHCVGEQRKVSNLRKVVSLVTNIFRR